MKNNPFAQYLRPVVNRIKMMVARGILKVIYDAEGIQKVQLSLMAGEIKDGIERFQDYGFTSMPHENAEAVVIFHSGNRDHGICIKIDDRRYRLKGLNNGDVALYSSGENSVIMRATGDIEVNSPEKNITLDNQKFKVLMSETGDAELSNENLKVSMKSTGEIELLNSNSSARYLVDASGKFKIENPQAELFEELENLLQSLIAAVNAIGTPFSGETIAAFQAILIKVQGLKS